MKIDDKNITDILDRIRRQVNADRKEFVPPPSAERIDKDLTTLAEVLSLFHDSGILIHAGKPVFAYIRDHTFGQYPDDPVDRKKIHFTVCQTLINMKNEGRFDSRYRLTSRDDDQYLVDITDRGRTKELDGQILYPCKYCLDKVSYHCYSSDMTNQSKNRIVRKFTAKEAFSLLWQQFDIFRQQTSRLRPDIARSGYSHQFPAISRAFRKSRNFTCEKCSVQLRHRPGLVDTHHEDGDKSNDQFDNLSCLCKLCHAEQPNHYHYKVSPGDRDEIQKAREAQGI